METEDQMRQQSLEHEQLSPKCRGSAMQEAKGTKLGGVVAQREHIDQSVLPRSHLTSYCVMSTVFHHSNRHDYVHPV